MRRITTRRILQLWFKGVSRDEIARTVNVSGSTVTAVVKEFEATADMLSLDGAGISYGIKDQIKDLRALSKEIRKSATTIPEAKRGAKLLTTLAKLNVTPDKLHKYIRLCKKLQHPRYKPKEFITKAVKLSELEEETGKSYVEIVTECDTKSKEIDKLEPQVKGLKNEIRRLRKERRETLRKNNLTKQEVAYVKKLRENLASHRIDLSQADELKTFLDEVKRLRANPEKAIEYIREAGSLETKIEQLHEKRRGLERNVATLEGQRKTLQDQLTTNNEELQNLQEQIRENEKKNTEILRTNSNLLKVEASVKTILEGIEVKSHQLEKLNAEISRRQQATANLKQQEAQLQADINAAKAIIAFLTNPDSVSDWNLSELQEKLTWILKVRRGEAPLLKPFETQMSKDAKTMLAKIFLPLVKENLDLETLYLEANERLRRRLLNSIKRI